jgi:hypothetical protein
MKNSTSGKPMIQKSCILFASLLFLAACQTVTPDALQKPSEPATSMPVAPLTTAPSREYLSFGSVITQQSGKAPDYTIKVETPVMNGSKDPKVVTFNKIIATLVQKQIDDFKKMLVDMPKTPISAGSGFDLKYELLSPPPPAKIISLKFDINEYADGAAHPLGYSVTLNYDLDHEEELTLDRLFLPNTNYLQAISAICKTELGKRDIGFDAQQQGADPSAENYRNWNITVDGLLITFDPYQVAAYAAGPQTVTIPYAALKSMIDPNGPLAEFQ